MENKETKTVGRFGCVAYFVWGIGIVGFLLDFIGGERRDYNDEWLSYDRMINTTLFFLVLGLVLYVIDRIIHR